MSTVTNKTNPVIYIAAVSVIVFSAVGVGVMTGLIPSGMSTPAPTQPAVVAQPAPVVAVAPTATPAVAKPVVTAAPTTPAAHVKTKTNTKLASANTQIADAKNEYKAPPAPVICANCGVIASINTVEQAGEGSGLGAIAGGLLGGVLGHQVGAGTGKDIATIAGAAGGAYAGHQIEKSSKKTVRYDINVRMDDGTSTVISQPTEPVNRVGDKVKLVNGVLTSNY